MCAADYWYVKALNDTAGTVLMYLVVVLACYWLFREIRKEKN